MRFPIATIAVSPVNYQINLTAVEPRARMNGNKVRAVEPLHRKSVEESATRRVFPEALTPALSHPMGEGRGEGLGEHAKSSS